MDIKIEKKGKVSFKSYDQNQLVLLPQNLSDLIDENHLVRVVNMMVDRLDIEELKQYYPGGGCSSYHPKMMIKILVYGYCMKAYSTRQIAKCIRQDITFMWLAGNQRPDFRTINLFRKDKMNQVVDIVFTEVLLYLVEQGYVDLSEYYVDGTLLEANANKYSYIWAKNTNRYTEGVIQRIAAILNQIEQTNAQEEEKYGDQDLAERGENKDIGELMSSAHVRQKIGWINEQIALRGRGVDGQENPTDKAVKKELEKAKTKLEKEVAKLEKYEHQSDRLGGRNSYSKTDPDATFMRKKNTDELIPAYNVQCGSQNQFIIHYSVHQNANDATNFSEHLERLGHRTGGKYPDAIIGDSIYGTEENYSVLEDKQIENYLKYPTFYREQKRSTKPKPFWVDDFIHDPKSDTLTCPNRQTLYLEREQKRKLKSGFIVTSKTYQCFTCADCPFRARCKVGEGNKSLKVSWTLEKYKRKARENLTSQKGLEYRSKRGYEIESCFGDIKGNMEYDRARLRGMIKVDMEVGLVCVAHNLRKIFIQNQGVEQQKRA